MKTTSLEVNTLGPPLLRREEGGYGEGQFEKREREEHSADGEEQG